MELKENIKELISRLTKERKIIYIGVGILAYLIILLITATIIGGVLSFGLKGDKSHLWLGLHDYFILSFLGSILISLGLYNILSKVDFRNQAIYRNADGVFFMKNSTFGGARMMFPNEIKEVCEVTNIENTHSHIYGQLTKDGEEVVAYKKPTAGGTGTQNVLLIASAGRGKSFTIGRVNLLQAIDRGDSFVCSDPSGELYRSIAGYCKLKGVDLHVLNLKEPKYSEFWNCLEETIDPETERLDGTRLNDFAGIFMENSGDQNKDFWYNSALNLVKAVIGYIAYEKEKGIVEKFRDLYLQINNGIEDFTSDKMVNSLASFKWCKEEIRKAAKEKGVNLKEVDEILFDIQYVTPKIKFTISEVVDVLLHFGDVEENMKNIPSWHPANYSYLMYKTSDNENVRQSALQGAQLRFNFFTDTDVREIVSHDGMHISDINKKQSAYFICMSDKTNTLKPIASLFFSFLFKDLQDNWDKAQDEVGEGNPNPCRPTTIMLDEFYSIGVIGGSPENFGTYMSNSRKRELHIYIILQGYSQLQALYGPNIKNIIQGQCSTLIYLGGNDPDTVKFISEFAAGESTVLTESHTETANVISNSLSRNSGMSTAKRMLMTMDEARRFKKVLVVKQGEYPMVIEPFPWISHPAYLRGDCQSVDIHKEIKPLDQRMEEINSKKPTDFDTYAHDLIANKTEALFNGGGIMSKINKQDGVQKQKHSNENREDLSSLLDADESKIQDQKEMMIEQINEPQEIEIFDPTKLGRNTSLRKGKNR